MKKIINNDSNNPEHCFSLGYEAEKLEKWEEAKFLYINAIDIDSSNGKWHFRLGFVYQKLKDWDQAKLSYTNAIEIDSSKSQWHYRLGFVYQKLKDWNKANIFYAKAIEIDSTKGLWHYRQGCVYQKLKRWEESCLFFQKAISIDSQKGLWYFQLGYSLNKLKQWDKSSLELRKAINLDSTKGLWHYQLGYALFKLERWKDTNTALRNAINLDDKKAQWFYQLGIVLEISNKFEESADAFQAAINLDNKKAQWFYQLGMVLEKSNKFEESADAFQAAINLDNKKAQWFYQLGMVLEKSNKFEESADAFQTAINLDNKNAQWFYQLGCVLQKSNSWKKSSDAFQSAINLDNTNPQYYYKLRCVSEKNGLNAKDLNYVPVSVDSLFESLCVITEFLDDIKVPYIISAGTLLGAVRQGDLFSTDTDWDIEILDDGLKTILGAKDLLKAKGYIIKFPLLDDAQPISNEFDMEYQIERRIIKIEDLKGRHHGDLFIHSLFRDGILRRLSLDEGIYWNAKMAFPMWFFENREKVKIRDRFFSCANNPELSCERIYGPDWRIPKTRHKRVKGYNYAGAHLNVNIEKSISYALKKGWIPRYPDAIPWPQFISHTSSPSSIKWIERHEHLEAGGNHGKNIDDWNAIQVLRYRSLITKLKRKIEKLLKSHDLSNNNKEMLLKQKDDYCKELISEIEQLKSELEVIKLNND